MGALTTTERYTLKKLGATDLTIISHMIQQIDPKRQLDEIKESIKANFGFNNYVVIGFYEEDKLIGLTSCWTTVKVYSGKQLEVDNVIIDNRLQSKGYGRRFFELIEDWARIEEYRSIELNTFIHNVRSHKFYFNQGFHIGGYHFHKPLLNN